MNPSLVSLGTAFYMGQMRRKRKYRIPSQKSLTWYWIQKVPRGLIRGSIPRNTRTRFAKHACTRLGASFLQAANKAPRFSMADTAELYSTRKEWGKLLISSGYIGLK